jgi:hypothetical protein
VEQKFPLTLMGVFKRLTRWSKQSTSKLAATVGDLPDNSVLEVVRENSVGLPQKQEDEKFIVILTSIRPLVQNTGKK